MHTPRTEQSISEMTFCVFQRPLHPELFEIHRARQFFQGDYEVAIWVTNSGHVVSVFTQGHCITELICSPEQLLPSQGLVQQSRFRREKSLTCSSGPVLRYMVNYQIEEMSRNLFRSCHGELVKAGKRRGMFVSFPQWARNELAPFSYLDYEARPEELRVHTYHAFPEHQALLKTQSLFDLREH